MRTIRYQLIADDLRDRIRSEEFAAGQVLPSEASLVDSYEASRVTIRKALEILRDEVLIDSRQGFGWFVASDPVRQPLTALDTIEAKLKESGRQSQRRIIDFKFVDSPAHVSALIGPRSLEVRRVILADGQPFARVTVWCREDLGADLSKAAVEQRSFYDLLPVELGGATQTIGAVLAGPEDAKLLDVAAESPMLVVKRTTTDVNGRPVLVSEHVFPGHLTEFVVDLESVRNGVDSPSGLRLLDESG
ncbi:MAG: GntR family transcriptional regulator [Acidimicrobiales bacterium]